MNWRFWKWELWTYRAALRRVRQHNQNLVMEVENLIGERNAARRQRDEERAGRETATREMARLHFRIADLERQHAAAGVLRRLEKLPMPDEELLQALATVTAETPWWRALHRVLLGVETEVNEQIILPGRSTEEVHRLRGQLAAIAELRGALLDWQQRATTLEDAA